MDGFPDDLLLQMKRTEGDEYMKREKSVKSTCCRRWPATLVGFVAISAALLVGGLAFLWPHLAEECHPVPDGMLAYSWQRVGVSGGEDPRAWSVDVTWFAEQPFYLDLRHDSYHIAPPPVDHPYNEGVNVLMQRMQHRVALGHVTSRAQLLGHNAVMKLRLSYVEGILTVCEVADNDAGMRVHIKVAASADMRCMGSPVDALPGGTQKGSFLGSGGGFPLATWRTGPKPQPDCLEALSFSWGFDDDGN